MTTHQEAATAAYVAGWRQNDDGSWWRSGTAKDALTLHHDEDDTDEFPFGTVLASTPEEALRVDRETFGRKGGR